MEEKNIKSKHPVRRPFMLKEEEKQICTIEELCYISIAESGKGIQLGRKNGTHVSFIFSRHDQARSFLTLVSGYYRLCEKWTFSLCDAVTFPYMQSLIQEHIHGPIQTEFAERKFMTNVENEPGAVQWKEKGTYLVHQSCKGKKHC